MARRNQVRQAVIFMAPVGVALHPVTALLAGILIVATTTVRNRFRWSTPVLALAFSYALSLLAVGRFFDSLWLTPALVLSALSLDALARSLTFEDRKPLLFGLAFLSATLTITALAEVYILGTPRASAMFAHANILGAVALISGCSLIIGAFGLQRTWQRVLVLVAGLASLLTVMLTGSRGATAALMIGLVLGGLLYAAGGRISWRSQLLVVALVAIVAAGSIHLFGSRLPIQTRFDQAAGFLDPSDRLYLWSVGLDMLTDRPLLGFGHQAWSRNVGAYEPMLENREPHSHSLYLEIALDSGLLGLVVFSWVLVGVIGRLIRARARLGPWFPVAAATTAGVLAVNVTDVLLYQLPVVLLWWILVHASLAPADPPLDRSLG